MAISYGFFDSVGGDRRYNAADMSKIFDGLITDGVYMNIGTQLRVVPGSGLSVNVSEGRAWFFHTWTYNSENYTLPIAEPNILHPRIDLVVLEVNREDSVRANSFKVLTGIPAVTPVPPSLVFTENVHQYALAEVYVEVGLDQVVASDITNKVGLTGTPFVTSILEGMDIDGLINQWGAQWTTWKTEQQAEFMAWFNNLVAVLTPEVAANLQLQINSLKDNLSYGWKNIPGDLWSYEEQVTPQSFRIAVTEDLRSEIGVGTKIRFKAWNPCNLIWHFNGSYHPAVGSDPITLTALGSPSVSNPGRFDRALTLNGIDQGLAIDDTNSLKSTSNLTIGCWFKTSLPGTIFSNVNFTGTAGYKLEIEGSKGYLRFSNTGPWPGASEFCALDSNINVLTGIWNHVVVTVNDQYAQMYLNGELVGSKYMPLFAVPTPSYPRIGCYPVSVSANTGWFTGSIDDLFFMNHSVLSEERVKQIFSDSYEIEFDEEDVWHTAIVTRYESPNTIEVFCGTDTPAAYYDDMHDFQYSKDKAPIGFNTNHAKWSIHYEAPTTYNKTTSFSSGVWYSTGVQKIIPYGAWNIQVNGILSASKGTSGTVLAAYLGLKVKLSDNPLVDVIPIGGFYQSGLVAATATEINQAIFYTRDVFIPQDSVRVELLVMSDQITGMNGLGLKASKVPNRIVAVCAYI